MVFDDSDIGQFISDGYVVLRGAFSQDLAEECREYVWGQVPSWDECTTYGQPMVQLRKGFGCAPFDRIMNDRLGEGLDQVVGTNRWRAPQVYGWWSLLLPGFSGPGGWHVDGGNFRTSGHLTDHHHALVTLFLFSDAGPGEGGTAMIRGSHLTVSRAIADARAGANWDDLKPTLSAAGVLSPSESQIAHLVGQAGDVALMHPFLIHGFGANQGNRIRFACNPLVQLRDHAELERLDGEYSPVELALRKGLGLE
jgi:Phytanoyl-CoA dioxygenase (PhyH)